MSVHCNLIDTDTQLMSRNDRRRTNCKQTKPYCERLKGGEEYNQSGTSRMENSKKLDVLSSHLTSEDVDPYETRVGWETAEIAAYMSFMAASIPGGSRVELAGVSVRHNAADSPVPP
jgi:hypothetical protein